MAINISCLTALACRGLKVEETNFENSILKDVMQRTSEEGLVRGIRKWDLIAVAINAVIGAGIFGLPAKVYSLIGSYSLIAFVVCALVVMLIILCCAEVGSRFDETGGPYLYAREAFGSTIAFEVGWLIWLARLTAFAANCNLLVSYLAFFWPSANSTIPAKEQCWVDFDAMVFDRGKNEKKVNCEKMERRKGERKCGW